MIKRGALHFRDQKLTQGVEVMFHDTSTKWLAAPGKIVKELEMFNIQQKVNEQLNDVVKNHGTRDNKFIIL